MKIVDPYQTLLLPNGQVIHGLFPTVDWFNKISDHIDFKDQTMLDLGCATFSYGIQAIQAGARFVTGVDIAPSTIQKCNKLITYCGYDNAEVLQGDVNTWLPVYKYNIILFSMVLHWLDDAENTILKMADYSLKYLVFIYRLPTSDPNEFGYRPLPDQLSTLLGLKPIASEKIMDTNQQIQMVIFDKGI